MTEENQPSQESVEAVPAPDAVPAADATPPAAAVEAPAAAGAPAQWPAAPSATPSYEAPGYPAPGYPAPGYPAPGYSAAPPGAAYAPAYAPGPKTSSNAIIALVLSIASWMVCPIVPAIIGLVFASMASKEIEASGNRLQGRGMVTAARIVSWINIGFFVAAIVVTAFVLVLVAIAGGMDSVRTT